MAVIVPTSVTKGAGVAVYTWTGMANGDTGTPIVTPASADKTVQADGTFSVGGSIAVQGSNNGAAFGALNDADGNVIALTVDTIIALVRENPLEIRPAVTAGDGSTLVDCILVVKRTT